LGVDLAAKRVELLREAVDGLTKVVLFVNPGDPNLARIFVEESNAAAGRLGLSTQIVEITTAEELEAGFDAISQSAGITGIIVNNDGLLLNQAERIARSALTRRMPTLAFVALMVRQGALLSYGPDNLAIFRRSATYVDKILKGARPADLPVEQPTDYQLFINMKQRRRLALPFRRRSSPAPTRLSNRPIYFRCWHIASLRCAAELGRYRGIADHARTCRWLNPVVNDPKGTFGPSRSLAWPRPL
jgi:putative tryptophan/tyrosine transport system substrate-binding protein